MFDLHCHVLPALDDGAGTMEESLRMLEKAAESGVKGVAATPHSLKSGNRSRLLPTLSALREAAKARQIPIRIYGGQELLLNEYGVESLEKGDILPLNGSSYLLCEFDFDAEWEEARRGLLLVRKKGLLPIVAHPERYGFFCGDIALAEEIHDLGGLLQINRGSVMGRHGDEAEEAAWFLLRKRLADFVASDGHSPYLRTSELADVHEVISMEFSYVYAEKLLTVNPGRVLRNEKLPG